MTKAARRLIVPALKTSWFKLLVNHRVPILVTAPAFTRRTLPVAAPPLNAQNVSQRAANITPRPGDRPFFEGPRLFVRISAGAVGPVFISQNHSPSITECPNGDLLAVWFSTIGETDLTTANADWVKTHFDLDLPPSSAYDVFPTYPGMIVLKSHNTQRTAIGPARFGLIPAWAKDEDLVGKPITHALKPLAKNLPISTLGQNVTLH